MLCFYDVLIYLFIATNVWDPGKTSYILFYYYYALNKLSMIICEQPLDVSEKLVEIQT